MPFFLDTNKIIKMIENTYRSKVESYCTILVAYKTIDCKILSLSNISVTQYPPHRIL